MAKRRSTAGSTAEFNKFVSQMMPYEDVLLPMAAATTTAVYVDVDTHLKEKQALLVMGFEYIIESIAAPETPLGDPVTGGIGFEAVMQLQRGDDHTALIGADDDDLVGQKRLLVASANASDGISQIEWPLFCPIHTISFKQKLRFVFDCTADLAAWNGTGNQAVIRLYRKRVDCPKQIAEEVFDWSNL